MQPGLSIQGHGEDQVIVGRIADASGSSVTVETAQGEKRTLQIVPETAVELDGRDASSADLAEGQPVRASFDVVDGQEVAVKIRAGDDAPSDASPQGTGSSAQEPRRWTGRSAEDPSSDAPGRPTDESGNDAGGATPDAGWGPPASGGAGETGSSSPQR